mgnify:CR=1 FL=1
MKRTRRITTAVSPTGAPFLHRIVSLPEKFDSTRYPFNIQALSHGIDLSLRTNVTFFVGENGSGKSTLLEALAECCGFNPEGGNRDHNREVFADRSDLAQALRLSWFPKATEGFFMRAEASTISPRTSSRYPICGRTAENRYTSSPTVNPSSRFLQIVLSKDFTSLTSRRLRCHRNGNCRFSRSFTTLRLPGMRNSSSRRTRLFSSATLVPFSLALTRRGFERLPTVNPTTIA